MRQALPKLAASAYPASAEVPEAIIERRFPIGQLHSYFVLFNGFVLY